jgi:hypothetical protein
MGIPDQLEKRIVLRASSIERHFYERLVRHECVHRLMIGLYSLTFRCSAVGESSLDSG